MEERDLEDVNCWKERLSAKNWNIEVKASIPHEALLQTLVEADGLLLLSASRAAIPSKLFEYLAVKRPILAATPRGSAVWRIGERLPQVFLFDYADADARASIERFLQAIEETVEFSLPEHFAEPYLSRVFLDKVLAA